MSSIIASDLQNVELIAGFQPSEIEELVTNLNIREFAESDMVFDVGDESRSIYIVLSGRVQIDLIGSTADDTKLVELGPGEVFGETTFFHAAEHNNRAWCQEASRLAELPFDVYEKMLKNSSSMAYHLGANAAHILAARLQQTDQWIREVLDRDEQVHRRELRDRYHDVFHPSFSTPGGFVGLCGNW